MSRALTVLLTTGCLADIRPATITDAAPGDGRAIMAAAAEAHGGLDAWSARDTLTVEYIDTWKGAASLLSPWPERRPLTIRHDLDLHTFNSEVEFLDGRDPGLRWGISEWQTWSQEAGGERKDRADKSIRFILPTMHYFVEFPYRLLEAPIILDAGPATIGQTTYDTAFLTWESTEPSRQWDQYIVYIDPDTGRIAKASYTVREIGGMVKGTIHFADYREIDGAWLPHRMTVTTNPEDDLTDYLHEVVVEGYTF